MEQSPGALVVEPGDIGKPMPAFGPGHFIATSRFGAIVALLLISIAALALRVAVLDRTNLDLVDHFLPWIEDMRARGFWVAVSEPFSRYGYTPFYNYAIGLANAIFPEGTDGKIVIKSVSIFFDFVAAGLVYALAMLRWKDRRIALLAFSAILFAPTVFLNGAYWGQSDIVYSSFLLACLYALLSGAASWAVIWFAVALAIKLQAAWFGPFILMMVLRGRIRWWLLGLIPAIYLLLALPTLLVGRSLLEVATIYLTQAGTQSMLNYSAANIQFFPQYFLVHMGWGPALVPLVAKASVIFVALLGLVFAWRASRGRMDAGTMLLAALTSVLIAPQFLPYMHNRYFFPADILAIVLVLWRPAYWPAALLMQASSFVTYISFLWGVDLMAMPVPAWLAALHFSNNLQPVTGLEALGGLANLALLVVCWRRMDKRLHAPESKVSPALG